MKILFISLGCDKNLVDTEVMLGLLASRGYEMTDDERQADIIVINALSMTQKKRAFKIFLRWQNIKSRDR